MAQVPGYQGLRFTVKYNCGINHPGMFGRPGKLPALFHHGSVEYVVSRKVALGIDYGFMTYNAPAPKMFFKSYEAQNFDRNAHKGRYTQHVVSLYAKYFFSRRGFIAPVGPYLQVGAFYQYSTNNFYSSAPGTYGSYTYYSNDALQINRVKAHYGGAQVGLGRNFIVANRMVVDLGFVANLTVATPGAKSTDHTPEVVAFHDLILRNLFQLHVGIGVLAF